MTTLRNHAVKSALDQMDRVRRARLKYFIELDKIQCARNQLNDKERAAYQEFIDECKRGDNDNDPTVMQQIKGQLTEIWRGPAYGQREALDFD